MELKYKTRLIFFNYLFICSFWIISSKGDLDQEWELISNENNQKNESVFEGPKSEKIYRGRLAHLGEFPYLVLIIRQTRDTFNKEYPICGGTIITATWVLTSANCLLGRIVASHVLAGIIDRNNLDDRNVKRVIDTRVHRDYDVSNHFHNIGLLKVHEEFFWGEFVKPVILIKRGVSLPNDSEGIIIGWGDVDNGIPSVILRKTKVKILQAEECMGRNIRFIFCSENDNSGPCMDDTGGPLMVENKQVGLISHVPSICGNPNILAKYVNVAYYRNWIEEEIGL